jgi:hypothetical protein
MLDEPVKLSGIVTDQDGRPLAEVSVDHSGSRSYEEIKTDSAGHFEVECRGSAIVFRKSGYASKYWRIGAEHVLSVVLAGRAPRMNICVSSSTCLTLKGFPSTFCLPQVAGVKVTRQANDVDYGQRFFWFRTPRGKIGIQHASGPMWSGGLPFDQDVWSARRYSERSYVDPQGLAVNDARGQSPDGTYWRLLGHAFETAAYRNVAEQDTRLLNEVLDGACIEAK